MVITADNIHVLKVLLKCPPPPFWHSNIKPWLLNAEDAFTLFNITCDETKYASHFTYIGADSLHKCGFIIQYPQLINKKLQRAANNQILRFRKQTNLKTTFRITARWEKLFLLLCQMQEVVIEFVTEDHLKTI